MKRDFTKLDAAIVAAVRNGCSRMDAINAGSVALEATAISTNDRSDPPARIVDRRLQALKKLGKIECVNRHSWRVRD